MCNVVLACIAYYSYVGHGCVCVCKRWCYINMLDNHPPTHIYAHTHTPQAHTHIRMHVRTQVGISVHTVILCNAQFGVKSMAKLDWLVSMLYYIY